MKLTSERQYVAQVEECPRCGEDHERVMFSRLANPEGRNDLWTLCPENHQPILASTEDLD